MIDLYYVVFWTTNFDYKPHIVMIYMKPLNTNWVLERDVEESKELVGCSVFAKLEKKMSTIVEDEEAILEKIKETPSDSADDLKSGHI